MKGTREGKRKRRGGTAPFRKFLDLPLIYRLVHGITHQKQQMSEKGDIARQYIDT